MESDRLLFDRPRKSSQVSKAYVYACAAVNVLSLGIGGVVAVLIYAAVIANDEGGGALPAYCSENAVPELGMQIKNCWFPFMEKGWSFLNHGSYGVPPVQVREAAQKYRDRSQENADAWFRHEMVPEFDKTRQRIADYIEAEKSDVVLVDDATEAINAVVRSIELPPNTRVIRTSFAYLMVQNALNFVLDTKWPQSIEGRAVLSAFLSLTRSLLASNHRNSSPTVLDTVELDWPSTEADAHAALGAAIANATAPTPSLLVLDHISSSPMMVFDVVGLAQQAKALYPNIRILVDGAHALGQIPLNMSALQEAGVTYYTGNGHKWLCAERGAAFLWVAPEHQAGIHPAVISNRYKGVDKGWPSEFTWRGTRDYSPLPALQAALDVREKVGDEKWRDYNNNLCKDVGALFKKRFAGAVLPYETDLYYSMVNVGPLPCNTEEAASCYTFDVSKFLFDYLFTEKKFVVVGYEWQDRIYFRLSCQVYNRIDEYETLFNVIDEYLHEKRS